MLVVIYAKILYQSCIPTIYENVQSIMFAYLLKRKSGNLHICLIWAIEIIKKKLGAFDANGHGLKDANTNCIEPYNFYVAVICNERATQKVLF